MKINPWLKIIGLIFSGTAISMSIIFYFREFFSRLPGLAILVIAVFAFLFAIIGARINLKPCPQCGRELSIGRRGGHVWEYCSCGFTEDCGEYNEYDRGY